MQVTCIKSGGFAGIRQTTSVDTTRLAADQAQELVVRVDAANFFALPAIIRSPRPQPDRFQFALTVEDDGRRHTVTVSESSVPAELRQLIEWLQSSVRR
jgi:hypothetical protein